MTTEALKPILPGVFLVPQNGRKGFGYSHFVERAAGNLILDASRVGSISDAFDEIGTHGGVKAAVISDRHLGGASTNQIAERFAAGWRPGNSSRKKMLKSFEGLRDLDFDCVVAWTGYAQTELFVPIPSVDAAVDAMIAACPKP